MAERLIIRSYRRVFEVDRRLYRVDRWALPVPGGVPLRGLAYFAATVVAVAVLGRVPGVGELLGALAPPLRYVVLPLVVAVLATQAAPDGRTAHRFASDWLRMRLRARRHSAGRRVILEAEPLALARRAPGRLGRARRPAPSCTGARAGEDHLQHAGRVGARGRPLGGARATGG